jgi:hypothetical protein
VSLVVGIYDCTAVSGFGSKFVCGMLTGVMLIQFINCANARWGKPPRI